ncbi:MAG: hypothetical protein ABIP94_14005 [Planctomycetota bacterium]
MRGGIVALYESHAQTQERNLGGGFVPLPPMQVPIEADGSFCGQG